jgi:cytochrome c553
MRLDPAQLDRGAPASEYPTIKTTIGVAATTERWGGKVRIAPGDPSQSLLYQLISVRGGGENDQMPPIASLVVDQDYVTKVADWIRKMPPTSGTVATP